MIDKARIDEIESEVAWFLTTVVGDQKAESRFAGFALKALQELLDERANSRERDLKLFRKGIALGKDSVETADCHHPLYYNAINVEHEFKKFEESMRHVEHG